jgi:hypothetical protein
LIEILFPAHAVTGFDIILFTYLSIKVNQVCMWCWHHIKENLNGLCPACRVPYKDDPHAFAAVDSTEYVSFLSSYSLTLTCDVE